MGVDRPAKGERPSYVWMAPNWLLGELAVLEELRGADALAFVLWRAVTTTRLWASTSPERRAGLFSLKALDDDLLARRIEARALAPELADAMDAFDALTAPDAKSRDVELVAACQAVMSWAERLGYSQVAMQFAEAGASMDSVSPALANLAGRVCRRAGERARAELWYTRAIGLARATQNAREYVSGYLGAAAVLRDGGAHARALRLIRRAGATARRTGMRGKAAEAFHDALGVAVLEGDLGRAIRYAKRALAVYPVHHRRFPAFAYDVSYLLVNRGSYATALGLLGAALPKIGKPGEQLVVMGTLARAAGGAGQRARFLEVAQSVESLASTYPATGAGALFSTAEGARLLRDWELAERLAHQAVAAARANDAVLVLDLAQALCAAIAERRPGMPPASDDPYGPTLHILAAEARRRLDRWRGPTWRPRRYPDPDDPPP